MKRLLVLSGKGGTGKTTTSAAFMRFAEARAFADCDVDAPNLHLVAAVDAEPERSNFLGSDKAWIDADACTGCGMCAQHCRFGAISYDEQAGVCAINEFACEGCGLCVAVCAFGAVELREDVAGELALYRGERMFSTARLKMGRGNSGKLVAAVKKGLDEAVAQADAAVHAAGECDGERVAAAGECVAQAPVPLAIIDGSPGIGCPVIASISGVDLVLVVTEPTLSGRSDLDRLLQTAASFRVPAAVCINKWDASPEHAQAIEAYCEERGVPCVGKVPYDKQASAAINAGLSVADFDCPARDALFAAYERTMGLLGC